MADVCSNVPAAASPSKCREARRRRIQMRRSSSSSEFPTHYKRRAAASSSSAAGKRHNTEIGVSSPQQPSPPPFPPPQSTSSSLSPSSSEGSALGRGDDPSHDADSETEEPPRFGWISVSGRSREMEDALTVLPHFLSPEDPFHFFGVFDGHGGSHVSALCRDRMHAYLVEELRTGRQDCGEDMWRAAMARSFMRMDEVAMLSCACGRVGTSPPCTCERSGMTSEIVWSTAVVAVVGPRKIVVANCGDSRAVLSRGGRAIPLSNDHKPDRADELERIEAAGGRVIQLNGGARVLGILAMSRAIGDRYLKPPVISDPEVTITDRTPEDECLIIASDGLWDVLSNELACDIARHCLKDGAHLDAAEERSSGSSDARCMLAATLLTRLALGRMCLDNISVIVVDLQKYQRYQGCK